MTKKLDGDVITKVGKSIFDIDKVSFTDDGLFSVVIGEIELEFYFPMDDFAEILTAFHTGEMDEEISNQMKDIRDNG